MPNAAVDIAGLTHRYGDRSALREVDLRVEAGTLFGLLGPNGGGKTTLFRVLSTLLQPTAGSAQVFGHDTVRDAGAVRRRLGVVFQQPALDEGLTVAENLRFHGALYGLSRTAAATRADRLLTAFGLDDRASDRAGTLSGGLQRRVDLARGLLHGPDLLLLDEPTTALDPVARHAFWSALTRLRRDEGTTMMVATHLLEEADRCDLVGIIDRGRLVAVDTPAALKAALGAETLWIESDDLPALRDGIAARFGVEARIIGDALQVSHPDAPAFLGALYDAWGGTIRSATVRRPTLEDVFMAHAGYHLEERAAVLQGS